MTSLPHHPAERSTSTPHHDWNQLIGTWVEVHREGKLVRAGIVDEIMADAGIVWLASSGVERRVLFDTGSGYQISASPAVPYRKPGHHARTSRFEK